MSKNNSKASSRPTTSPVKTKLGTVIPGLKFDIYQDAEKVANNQTKEVSERVIATLVEEKHKEREDLLMEGLTQYSDLTTQIENVSPDIESSFDKEGKEIPARFSKKAYDNYKSLLNKLETLKEALAKAYSEGKPEGYDMLAEYIKKNSK